MSGHHNTYSFVLVVLGAFWMTGCASAPKLQSMIPRDEGLVFESTGATIDVGNVRGGYETDAIDVSKINAGDFRLALIESLRQSNLFAEVGSEQSDYALTAVILTQDQPGLGFAMTVDLAVKYVLTKPETGEEIFNDRIVSSYKAGFGEAFVGVTRVRKANEGAVRENIKQLLQRLATLLTTAR